jgi:hypothetical protein
MKYVRFYNVITESMYDGFLVKEEDGKFYTIDPICYEWLSSINRLDLIEVFETRGWEREFFPYILTRLNENHTFVGEKKWLFEFPLREEHYPYIGYISNYFEWFTEKSDKPLFEKIQTAKERTTRFIPSHIHDQLSDFIIVHYKNDPDGEKYL